MKAIATRRRWISVLAFLCGFAGVHCDRRDTGVLTGSVPPAEIPSATETPERVELDPRPDLFKYLQTRRVRVNDPVYGTKKEYEGYDLGEVMRSAFRADSLRSKDTDVVFVCSDGYRATLPLEHMNDGGVLAIWDTSVPRDIGWQPLRQGREYMLPAPFYLVWPAQPDPSLRYPWPYRVVAIELSTIDQGIQTTDARVSRGENVFRHNCIACHAMNLKGGTLAPELNVPLNVTEYWYADALRNMIRDPSRVRSASKMPAFPELSDAEIDAVIVYFSFMRDHKVRIH